MQCVFRSIEYAPRYSRSLSFAWFGGNFSLYIQDIIISLLNPNGQLCRDWNIAFKGESKSAMPSHFDQMCVPQQIKYEPFSHIQQTQIQLF